MLLSKLFPLYALLLWAGDAGAGGGDTSTGEGSSGAPAQSGPGQADSGQSTGGQPGSSGTSFSQADLDRVAGQTRKEALTKWAKEHGFEKIGDLEEVIKAKKEADDKSRTDLEKAQGEAQREKTAREVAEARLYQSVLRSAFERATSGKIADDLVDAAFLTAREAGLLNGDPSTGSGLAIVVDVDKASVSGMDKVVEKLLKDKPSFKKISQAAPGGTGGAEGGNGPAAGGKLTPEQEAAYKRRFGLR